MGYSYESFSQGLLTVNIFSVDLDTLKDLYSRTRIHYKGVINTEGEIVFSNESWEEITPFNHNRAFVEDTNRIWYLINKEGKVLNKKPIKKISSGND